MKKYELNQKINIDCLMNEMSVAKRINLSVATLRLNRHLNRGIPYYKIGKSVRYDPNDVKEYIKSKKIKIGEVYAKI